ncbi:MAG: hypothetical protein L0Z54_06660 [Thermoplasmata archaeon]|nr:hypothetical protein [Thermoplasmata archaeon]
MMGGDPRALEDPLQSLFELSREVSRMARWSMLRIYVTLLFLLFMVFFALLLLASVLASGSVGGALVFLGLFVAGLMAIHTTWRMRGLFRTYLVRHAAINAARKQPTMTIPEGETPAKRFLAYLRNWNDAFRALLETSPEALRTPGSLSGLRQNHRFDAYVFDRRFPRSRSYMLLVREYAALPTAKDVGRLVAEVEDIHAKWKVMPSRVVMVTVRPADDLSDEVYDMLVNGVDAHGGFTRFQVAIESADGSYDFIPLVPELHGFMP